MGRNILIGAALAVLLMGLGVAVGAGFGGSAGDGPGPTAPPTLLQADPPSLATRAARPGPRLLGEDVGARILARLTRMEAAIQSLEARQGQASRRLAAAGEIMAWLEEMKQGTQTARATASRSAAVATLRNVVSAQAQMQATGRVDVDRDGTGEYAGFRELSGAIAGRMSSPLNPPVLSRAFRTLNESGEVIRSGYHFRFYLPGPHGEGIGEPPAGFSADSGIDTDLAETTWCCYAWPAEAKAGNPTLFMNQMGDVLSTQDSRYAGPGGGPEPDAAFQQRGTITGTVAINKQGQDGNVWKPRP